MKDVMLDFETLGTGKDKCLLQVGACYFDRITGEIGAIYKANIDPASHVKCGGVIDAPTVFWWMQQSQAARESVLAPGRDIVIVMNELNDFLGPSLRIWSHATFDFVTLNDTLRQIGITPKYSYRAGMDIRTLVTLAGTNVKDTPRTSLHHDALEDCYHQVKYCVEAIAQIKGSKAIINAIQKIIT